MWLAIALTLLYFVMVCATFAICGWVVRRRERRRAAIEIDEGHGLVVE
mgnify:CR=1 FL=1